LEIVLTNRPEERRRLLRALEVFAAEHRLPAKVLQAADLALEEHLTNVLHYAYADAALHEIRVRLSCDERAFLVEVEDDGQAFNPLDAPPVDTYVPLEERPVGGLGIHLMRKFMDTLDYRREGGRNILRMTKRLEA
jgi:anti-sigma regulatory factor (Ser/Thr protein kinase)